MRLSRLALLTLLALCGASAARAEYVVLRSGQRLAVTSYQLIGEKYRLQMNGGFVEVPVSDVVAIEPEEVFVAVPVVEVAKEPFGDLILAAAKRYAVDADLITSVIAAESNFDPKAISTRNARGLMQLLPSTAADLGVKDIFDPQENIEAGARYLSSLLQLYKNDLALALAAYNAGPERVQLYGKHVPPFAETVSYVRRVKHTYEQRKSAPPPASSTVTAYPNAAAAAKHSPEAELRLPLPAPTPAPVHDE
jgi:transglycosylase-like protein with SLT domain